MHGISAACRNEDTIPATACIPITAPSYGASQNLPRAESISILLRFAPRLAKTPEAQLDHLAERLGDFPPAIQLAGRYLACRPRVTPQQYLEMIDRAAASLTASLIEWAGGHPMPGAKHAAVALEISLDALQRDTLALHAFAAAGFCAPSAAIPLPLLQKAAGRSQKHLPDPERILNKLYRFGLLEQTSQGPAIKPLLAGLALRTVTNKQETLSVLADVLVELCQHTTEPPLAPPVWPHLRPAAERAEQFGLQQAGRLWNSLGFYLWIAAETQPARDCFEHALANVEKILGAQHPDILPILNNLGRVHFDTGNYSEAKNCFERLLLLDMQLNGSENPCVAIDANNLGHALYSLGDLEGARGCFSQALSIHETADGYGPQHPTVAADAMNLGRVLRQMGDLEGAKAAFEHALSVSEWVYGPRHQDVSASAGQLARVLRAQGNLAQALPYFERQLSIEEIINGPEHPVCTAILNNIGLTLQDMSQYTLAREAFERALVIDEKNRGPNHPSIARDMNNLGSVLIALNDLQRAWLFLDKALEMNEKAPEPSLLDVATNANNLARVLYKLGELQEARQCFERVLAIDEKMHGCEHPEVAGDLTNLGIVLQELGDLPGARQAYEQALAIVKKTLPGDHSRIGILKKYLGRVKVQAEKNELS